MKTLYLDIFSGISGDMFIGALLDLGVDPRKLERELGKLKLDGYHLHVARQHKSAIEGVKFDVHLTGEHDHGHDQGHGHDHHHDHDLMIMLIRTRNTATATIMTIMLTMRVATLARSRGSFPAASFLRG